MQWIQFIRAIASGPPAQTYKLYTWGQTPDHGQNTGAAISSPTQLGSLTDWREVRAGRRGIHAVKSDGTLWGWGTSAGGIGGWGDTLDRSSPVQIGALTNWTAPINGYECHGAVNSSGNLFVWGYNSYGTLGTGNTTDYSSPVQLAGTTWTQEIWAGTRHVAAVKSDGTLWTWGRGLQGGLGNGSVANQYSPVQVGALTTWSTVGVGIANTLAIKTDGTLWVWGRGTEGMNGLGNTTDYSSPVQLGANTWTKIAARGANRFAVGLRTDGTLWGWGANGTGQLGLGNTTSYSSPVQIGSRTDWSWVEVLAYNSIIAYTTLGETFVWGKNNLGQLGLGNTTNYSSPVQLGGTYEGNFTRGGWGSQFILR
jgi:alpha-tubulin suppressor-like RCC1 family protein